MHLIFGPPGSGKTSACLARLRTALREMRDSCRLIVPTATMAEHLRNELAREGFVFKPGLVSTFTKFVEPYFDTAGANSGQIELAAAEVLARIPLGRYESVRDYAGFRASIVGVVEEFSSAGGTEEHLQRCGAEPDFVNCYSAVLQALKQRNLFLRASQLRQAALSIAEAGCPGVGELLFAGFYSFTVPELDVIRALNEHVKLTVALPEWAGAEPTLQALSSLAQSKEVLPAAPPVLNRVLCVAPTMDMEVAEIARRMLQAHDNGRPWREMGVLVRSERTYVPALRSAFARFGIPSRFYFSSPLADAPAVRFLRAVIDALLSGWDHGKTLGALRLPGARTEAGAGGDRFEFDVLARVPGAGLDQLRSIAGPGMAPLLDAFDALTPWTQGKALPQTWAARMKQMRSLFAAPDLQDRCSHDTAMLWRSHAAALHGFEASCDNAAAVLDPAAGIDARQFWTAVETMLQAAELRVPDHRRDVVHVIDAFEARQWSVPVLFVCGLLEKEFPKYQSEDAILPDAIRRHLQAQGVHVRTSVQRQSDERFLFDLALTRASEALVFSYPRLNAKGEANLPSFFLQHARPYVEDLAADVRPVAMRPLSGEPAPMIVTEESRRQLAARHARFSPTGIETFLQCPYQFFAERTLKLAGTPEQPWERLSALVQGDIVHRTLERFHREQGKVSAIFDEEFTRACEEAHVPPGYRTEAIRLEILHNLEMLAADARLPRGTDSFFEEPFELHWDDGTVLRGKIDRVEVDSSGAATVIDYKYRSPNGVQRTRKGHEEKRNVQGGLYLLGAESLGFRPAGMIYCGLRREVTFAGWLLSPHYPQVKQTCDPEALQDIMDRAREDSREAIAGIRAGRIEPAPADEMKCEYCAIAHACRYEVAAMRRLVAIEATGAGAGE